MNDTEAHRPFVEEDAQGDDPRLVAALREYQIALEAGSRPNRQAFLTQYPEIADELAECLDGLEFLHTAAPRFQSGEEPPPPAPVPDGLLGDFQLVREIGRGGMGIVYEAIQLSLGRRVALKVLPLAATLDARQLQRFENEARAAAHLHHSHIVPVFAVGCERGIHYYVMQLIQGRSLAAVIDDLRQTSRPAPADAETDEIAASLTHQSTGSRQFFQTVATLGLQAAEALEYAHQMGVVHRDIKPANLLLEAQGDLWVTDFGLARFQERPGLTAPGDLVGTLRYLSPEQAAGQPVIDPRSDIYGLGATLYELLTQRPAVPGQTEGECLRQIIYEEPVSVRRLNRAVPVELATIVHKAMAKQPEDRYRTARELADDLRRFLADEPIRARPPGVGERARRWAWRHRRVVGGALVGLVALVVILGATTWAVALAEMRTLAAYDTLKKEEAGRLAALKQEVTQRQRAERNFQQARKALDALTRVGVEELADKPQLQKLRQRLLTELIDYYQEFIDEQGNDPQGVAELIQTRLQLADLLDELGEKARSWAVYEQAMKDHERHQGGPRPGFPMFRGSFGRPFAPPRGLAMIFLLGQSAVQKDLKLSADQKARLGPLLEGLCKPPSGERPATEKGLAEVLRPEQLERLQQIIRQTRGAFALLDPEAAKALDLTDKQKAAIRAVLFKPPGERAGPGDRAGPGGRGGRGWGGRPPEGGKKGGGPQDQFARFNERILRNLQPEQRKRWQQMLGEPFRGELRLGPALPGFPKREHG
jgi:tRNA A-37 threonylcarbamoyl transferase component Bud32